MRKLIIAAVAVFGLVSVSSTTAFADGFAPGEGLYIGVFGGFIYSTLPMTVSFSIYRINKHS